jgi:CYTH domain-containing protein
VLDTLAAELQRCASAVHGIDDQETAHEARIAGKRLRYALEPLEGQVEGVEEVVKQLKRFQDALGEMHDAHVFSARITRLAAHAGDPHDARGAHDASDSPADDVPATRHGLEALAERLHARRDESFEAARAWIGDPGPGELLTAVWRIGQRLAARGRQDVEIERKYLLRALPEEAALAAAKEVEQGYLPGERLVERVRRVRDVATERYYRTVKLGSGVRRVEVEEEAPRELFEALWALTGGRRVSKRRHAVADGALTWEIDAFTDRDLVLAEVELPDADTAVVLPGWLAPYVVREVTDEPEFVNARLAR